MKREQIRKEIMTSLPIALRIPVRSKPVSGESLRGYLLRLSSKNGYASPNWLSELEPCLKRIGNRTAVLAAIKRLTGLSSLEQELLLPFGSNKLSPRFRTVRPRICAACVRSQGYIDAVYDIAFVSACPHHKILLADSCPECLAPLSWNRLGLDLCGCGAVLTAGESIEAGTRLLYLNALIWIAAGREVPFTELPGFPNEALSLLSLDHLCQLYWFLSSYGNGQLRLNRNRPVNVATAVTELKVVESLLNDWPFSIHRLLDSHRDKAGRFVGEGLQQAFGKIYRDLYGMLSCEKFTFVREAFEDYISTNWVGIIDGKYRRIKTDRVKNDTICVNEASKQIGISPGRLRKLVRLGVVKGTTVPRPSGRHHTIIFESDVRRFSGEIRFMLNRSEARALLGVSEKQFQMLLEAEVIKPLVRVGESGLSQWWFDSRPIEKILKEIFEIVPRQLPDSRAIPFMEVCQRHILCARFFPAFLEAVKSGTIPVAGIKIGNKFTLASLYFFTESIAGFRKEIGEKRIGIYSIPQVAVRLGVKQEVAYHLVNAGLLATENDHASKMAGRVVTEVGLNDFESIYVPLVQLARLHGTSVRNLQQKLSSLGIVPVVGRPVDKCRQIFYRRSDICRNIL